MNVLSREGEEWEKKCFTKNGFFTTNLFLTREGGVLLDQNIFTTGGGETRKKEKKSFKVFILTTRKELFNHKMFLFFPQEHEKMKWNFFFCNFCTEILVLNQINFFFHVSNRGNKKIHKCSAEYISCELWQIYSTRLLSWQGQRFNSMFPEIFVFPVCYMICLIFNKVQFT